MRMSAVVILVCWGSGGGRAEGAVGNGLFRSYTAAEYFSKLEIFVRYHLCSTCMEQPSEYDVLSILYTLKILSNDSDERKTIRTSQDRRGACIRKRSSSPA